MRKDSAAVALSDNTFICMAVRSFAYVFNARTAYKSKRFV